MINTIQDFFFKHRLARAIRKHKGVALCFHCLNPLVWEGYQDREIAITPSHKIMLFCPDCHLKALEQFTGKMIATAFYRWYTLSSGLPVNRFHECSDNVLHYYGWRERNS